MRLVRKFSGHWSAVLGGAFDPTGKYALTTSNDATVKLWEVSTGKPLRSFAGHKKRCNAARFVERRRREHRDQP
jgi:WD40 repeat protein